MLEKWKNAADKGKCCGALLADLSKPMSCHSDELMVAKLNTYCFDLAALKLIQSYLSTFIRHIAHGKKSYLEYHKDLFVILYYLIFNI